MCEYELAEHGNECEAGAYGKEKSEAPATACYSFERVTGDKAVLVICSRRCKVHELSSGELHSLFCANNEKIATRYFSFTNFKFVILPTVYF